MNVGARPLLSRVADSVYWLGRYMERAENVKHRAGLLDQLRKRNEAAWLREKADELMAPAAEQARGAGCA